MSEDVGKGTGKSKTVLVRAAIGKRKEGAASCCVKGRQYASIAVQELLDGFAFRSCTAMLTESSTEKRRFCRGTIRNVVANRCTE